MTLHELVERAHAQSRKSGWYDGENADRNIGEMLALIHSEVSEALECWRDGQMDIYQEIPSLGVPSKPCGFPSEIADIVIRVADLCGYLEIDLEKIVTEKMVFNATRPYRHGNKRA